MSVVAQASTADESVDDIEDGSPFLPDNDALDAHIGGHECLSIYILSYVIRCFLGRGCHSMHFII